VVIPDYSPEQIDRREIANRIAEASRREYLSQNEDVPEIYPRQLNRFQTGLNNIRMNAVIEDSATSETVENPQILYHQRMPLDFTNQDKSIMESTKSIPERAVTSGVVTAATVGKNVVEQGKIFQKRIEKFGIPDPKIPNTGSKIVDFIKSSWNWFDDNITIGLENEYGQKEQGQVTPSTTTTSTEAEQPSSAKAHEMPLLTSKQASVTTQPIQTTKKEGDKESLGILSTLWNKVSGAFKSSSPKPPTDIKALTKDDNINVAAALNEVLNDIKIDKYE
jgi:hypothetical protein